MEEKRLGIEDFKSIFKENYEEFLEQYPEHEKNREVIEKMIECGAIENGYINITLIVNINSKHQTTV
jgi:hypothetical protein